MIDILMITYNRPEYTQLSLKRLLETCDNSCRVWVWQNGNDEATLDVVRRFLGHPRLHQFHHSQENMRLREPTNWLWENADGEYVSKVDDDCLVPEDWILSLRKAHEDIPELGVLGCWRFMTEDFNEGLAKKKILHYPGGHQIMRNCWVEGSGYLMKRECVQSRGRLRVDEGFTQYCIDLALSGWHHGWYFPFLYQEHMDDPRAKHSLLKTDEDLRKYLPLSALNNGVASLAEWDGQLRRSAQFLQVASIDPKSYRGWRKKVRGVIRRFQRISGKRQQW